VVYTFATVGVPVVSELCCGAPFALHSTDIQDCCEEDLGGAEALSGDPCGVNADCHQLKVDVRKLQVPGLNVLSAKKLVAISEFVVCFIHQYSAVPRRLLTRHSVPTIAHGPPILSQTCSLII
jgi:hypothetical protein